MTYRIAHKLRPTIDDWQEIRRSDGAVIPPDVPALRCLGQQALDAAFDVKWKARNVEVQSRAEEREVMAVDRPLGLHDRPVRGDDKGRDGRGRVTYRWRM